MEATTLRFAAAVRVLGLGTRQLGLVLPGFRSPPRLGGVSRSLRRRGDGAAIVAVTLRGRAWSDVLADMIDGVVAANRLHGPAADAARTALWAALDAEPAARGRTAA
jgi:hypothetical protein